MAKQSKRKMVAGSEVFANAVGKVTLVPSYLSWFGCGLILFFAVLGAYADSLSSPFIFDDISAIQDNRSILHLWPPWAPLFPSSESTTGGRPILNLSFALNYAVSGFDVWSYHALNLLIHILAGLTLFGIVRRTLLQPALRDKFGADALPLALAIALLWTLHPLQTESVTYISQRAESLMGLFYLMTLYAFIRAVGSEVEKRGWSVICVVACFLGMATKEVMATAPLMVLLYDRTFVAGSFREAWRSRWRLYLALSASWVVLAYGFLVVGKPDIGFGYGVTLWSYAVTECGVIIDYLKLAFWPHPLVIDYGSQMVSDPWQVLPQASILAVLLIVTVAGLVRRPVLGFAGAWFFLILAPTSSVIPVALSPMAEHRLYLPLAGLVALVVLGLYAWMGRASLAVAGVLAIVCAVLTFERNGDYDSEIGLWQQAAELHPDNARAHYNLGLLSQRKGEMDGAMAQLHEALKIDPKDADAYCSLGSVLVQKGQLDEGIAQFQKALKIKPDNFEAHNNFGIALVEKGQTNEGIAHFKKALAINPNFVEAHYNLGKALVQIGRVDEAIAQYQKTLEINPNYVDAHISLGIALAQKGEMEEAIVQFQEAVRLKPDDQVAQYNLAKAQALERQPHNAQ